MREICIEDFLMNCNPSHVERHSDSSDFECPRKIPIIASKGGNHRLLSGKTCNTKQEKQLINYSNMSEIYNANLNKLKTSVLKTEQKTLAANVNNRMTKLRAKQENIINNNKNRGDQCPAYYIQKVNSKSLVRNKVIPSMSNIFRRRKNYMKHTSSFEKDQSDIDNCDRQYCANCERRRIKKFTKRLKNYSVHPVYTVEENIQGFPFNANNECKKNTASKNGGKNLAESNTVLKNNGTNINYDTSLSSESELENKNAYKHQKLLKKIKDSYEKEIRNEYFKYNSVKNEQQQYPSKFQLKQYQVFASSSCQAKCSSSGSQDLVKMPSSSSAFWDFLALKMKNKIQKPGISKSCDCIKPPEPCSPDNCEFLTPNNPDYYTHEQVSVTNSCCQQTDQHSSQSSTSSKKKFKKQKVVCKCFPNKKRKDQLKNASLTMQQDETTKPCQEEHDDITRAISEKYNGEILCIHNPPCILINGCLNLPPPKSNFQANLWPVTQNKKSSFVQMCRKIKRSKQKSYEQASQYHPPYIDLQECLPEFKTEKNIQSICNHDPPCEIVHGCYKAQYDPKLQNSCVHVPMCQNLPVCLMSDRSKEIQSGACNHSPKCTTLPICSRKYITLTAKEDAGTQVRQRTKMVCRHQPQCFMIPKCLAQAITGDYIPCGAIPGCVHHPCCEMIPACCRKSAKQMVSVPSQYPNACRIV